MGHRGNHSILASTHPAYLHIDESPPLRKIYNHDIMHCTADGVDGNFLYSARALGMTEKDDIIQLSAKLKPEWPHICRHYARIGLTHTKEVIWNTRLAQFSLHTDYLPSVFFFGTDEYKAHNNKNWYDVVNFVNSKNNFIALADRLGMPTPETVCFNSADEITPHVAEAITFPCYLKAAISVSGVGIHHCANLSELYAAAATFDSFTPLQVQEAIQTDSFLNLQYEVVNGECRRLLVTEQILDGTVHQGNRYPAPYAPWEVVEPMAEWMAERGFRDIFAFDVAVIEEDAGTRFLPIECNPRFNGASYPTSIALKLDIHEWEARNFRTWHKTLAEINLTGLEYDPKTGEGVIIVNWGPVLVGKVMIMLAGSAPVRQQLEVELKQRLW